MVVTAVHSSEQSSTMFHYLTVALLAVAAPMVLAEPSGLLGIGGPIIAPGLGLGLGGLGLGTVGVGHLGGAILAAPSSISIQKSIVAHPAPAVAISHAPVAVAAAPVAVAAHGLAIPSPAAATVVAGPSGTIHAQQTLAGTHATVVGPASVNHGHGLGGHGW